MVYRSEGSGRDATSAAFSGLTPKIRNTNTFAACDERPLPWVAAAPGAVRHSAITRSGGAARGRRGHLRPADRCAATAAFGCHCPHGVDLVPVVPSVVDPMRRR